MTRAFVAVTETLARDRSIDLIPYRHGVRKDDRTQERLRQWPGGEGVLSSGKAHERARVIRTPAIVDPVTGFCKTDLVESTAMPNLYSFYAVNDDFGPFFLKFRSYFPSTAKPCLHGHESVKRQLTQRGIACTALDNGLLECAEPERLGAICAEVTPSVSTRCCARGWRSSRIPSPPRTARRGCALRFPSGRPSSR